MDYGLYRVGGKESGNTWGFCLILLWLLFPPELEKQMKIENLFVTWQQRSAQSNMPISVSTAQAGGDSRLGLFAVH